jgi:hypothetical protein
MPATAQAVPLDCLDIGRRVDHVQHLPGDGLRVEPDEWQTGLFNSGLDRSQPRRTLRVQGPGVVPVKRLIGHIDNLHKPYSPTGVVG